MTVKEIIKNSATQIGREDIVGFLSDNQADVSEQTLGAVNVMVRLLNLVINELACSYVPMITVERRNATNGKLLLSQLSKSPREIINAYDTNGNPCLKEVTYSFIKVSADTVDVEYAYFPQTVTLNDNVGYEEKDIPSRVLAYGLCAEYAVSQGCFKDAVCWHDRYADAIAELCSPKNAKIKRREWL